MGDLAERCRLLTSSSVRDHLLDEKTLGKYKRRIPGPI
jgi:hypothetical protein